MSEQHTHSHHHHHGGIDDYMKAVAEYRKTFPNKQDVIEQTPDPAVREMLLHMEEMGLETTFDRFERNNLNVHLVLRVPAAKTALWDLAKLQKNPLVACVARTQI